MAALGDAQDRVYDLLVVGGGINGAGIARDAAMRGLSVCLVDKNDWGWATSAKSSMLAHGGLRYLEQFEFGLVHEALQERERLFRQAPHIVRPLRFLYPIYPHVANRRTVRVGLWLYDLLSRGRSVPGRSWQGPEETLRLAPGLEPKGLRGSAAFWDGQFRSVERLVVELVWDARRLGATCLNHTAVARLLVEEGGGPGGSGPGRRVAGAELESRDGTRVAVRAHATVNATGTWVDEVLGPLGVGRPAKVRKTKGIHVVLPRFCDVALVVKAASDGRTFFVLPWGQQCIVGTTDTDYAGDAADAVADPEDVEYLLQETRAYFPHAPLAHVSHTYAGVRALVNEEGLTESNVTRRHILYDHERRDGVRGLWSLQGGKITTYRSLAESCVDAVCRALGRVELAKRHPTRQATLPGGPLVPWDTFREQAMSTARAEGLPPPLAEHLVDTYGARWRRVLDADPAPAARERIDRDHPHVFAEATFAVREEDAATVADVMLRRTPLGRARDGNPAAARRVATWMARLLGWDAARVERELEAYGREAAVFWIDGCPPDLPLSEALPTLLQSPPAGTGPPSRA